MLWVCSCWQVVGVLWKCPIEGTAISFSLEGAWFLHCLCKWSPHLACEVPSHFLHAQEGTLCCSSGDFSWACFPLNAGAHELMGMEPKPAQADLSQDPADTCVLILPLQICICHQSACCVSLSTRLLTCAWGFVNKNGIGIMIKTSKFLPCVHVFALTSHLGWNS